MRPVRPCRREFLGLLAAGLSWPLGAFAGTRSDPGFRVRTITAGVPLAGAGDFAQLESALAFLHTGKQALEAAGYAVQTVRIATQPVKDYLPDWQVPAARQALLDLDQWAADADIPFSIGPVITADDFDPGFAGWVSELIRETRNLNVTVQVASRAAGVHAKTARTAAEAIAAIATATPNGEGNFRFAATAFCPPGTPFFPAAWHHGEAAFSIGLESPPVVHDAFRGGPGIAAATPLLRAHLNRALAPVEAVALRLAEDSGRRYLGIDTSPAPGLDASIGDAIEALSGEPFGSPSTLAACAAITGALQSLDTRTCGYSGLMLPVLEDRVLARRAAEGRFGVADLLLYSSVCGTGLDVLPLPGDTPVAALAAAILDVAALAARYRKALSARLLPLPGRAAGDMARFDNPHLTDATVMSLD